MDSTEVSLPKPVAPANHTPEPDPALCRAYHDGQAEAMEALAELYYGDIRRYALAVLRNEEKAQEAIQDTFLRLVEAHPLYQPERPFRPWLFTICRNCCLAYARQNMQEARIIKMAADHEDLRRLAAAAPRVWESMIRQEREAQALNLLAQMPELNKTIVILHLFEDLTFREIGEITEMPAASAATLYYRALADLRTRMSGEPTPHEERSHAV